MLRVQCAGGGGASGSAQGTALGRRSHHAVCLMELCTWHCRQHESCSMQDGLDCCVRIEIQLLMSTSSLASRLWAPYPSYLDASSRRCCCSRAVVKIQNWNRGDCLAVWQTLRLNFLQNRHSLPGRCQRHLRPRHAMWSICGRSVPWNRAARPAHYRSPATEKKRTAHPPAASRPLTNSSRAGRSWNLCCQQLAVARQTRMLAFTVC